MTFLGMQYTKQKLCYPSTRPPLTPNKILNMWDHNLSREVLPDEGTSTNLHWSAEYSPTTQKL